mgnify:CR=1 FL=1
MKTKFFGVVAFMASIFAMTACQKADDTWKQLPAGQISVESGKATISVNEVPCDYGNVQLIADGEDSGTLTLTGIVPGYADVKVNVDLLKKSDDSFAFKGTTIVSTPPSITATVRSTEDNPCYAVNVEGSITLEGEAKVLVATQVQGDAAPLIGSWNIVRKCQLVEKVPVNGPVQITWNVAQGASGNIGTIVALANTFACPLLTEVLNQVTFDESGNIMAQYYSDIDLGDEPLSKILALADVKPDADGNVTYTAHHTEWLDSPKANLAFWYAQGSSLFIVPNVSAIMNAAGSESTRTDKIEESGIDLSTIMEILSKLKEYGVDVEALGSELRKMMTRGIELKYSEKDGGLKIYVDKTLCAPVIEALLPALKTLDVMLDELAKSDDPDDQETFQTVQIVMGVLGLEKPSDLELVWKATSEFEIALNFTKA